MGLLRKTGTKKTTGGDRRQYVRGVRHAGILPLSELHGEGGQSEIEQRQVKRREWVTGGKVAVTAACRANSVVGCAKVYTSEHAMTETLSIRLDSATRQRLDALAKSSKRSKSFLAAEAIAAYVEQEEWQLGEIHDAIGELDAGQAVSHEEVATWLESWGTASEKNAPR